MPGQVAVRVHALVLDGVVAETGADEITFHPLPALSNDDVAAVLATVRSVRPPLPGRAASDA
jgi:hypothetical protein